MNECNENKSTLFNSSVTQLSPEALSQKPALFLLKGRFSSMGDMLA